MNNRKWTQEDDRILRKMWRRGASAYTIGKELNRTEKAVRHRRWILNLPIRGNYVMVQPRPNEIPRSEVTKIRILQALGWGPTRISYSTGISLHRVKYVLGKRK